MVGAESNAPIHVCQFDPSAGLAQSLFSRCLVCHSMLSERTITSRFIANLTLEPKVPNRPFPSCLLPLYQNESTCETFHMKMRSACSFIFMQIKVIFIWMALRLVLKQRHKWTQKWPIWHLGQPKGYSLLSVLCQSSIYNTLEDSQQQDTSELPNYF